MGTGFSKKKKEAKVFQQQFQQLQGKLQSIEAVGTSSQGLVSITLNGDGDLKQIKINPECVDREDVEGLEMLIKSAYEDAQKKLKAQTPTMPGLPAGFPGF
ncbi:MAG: YbaB/EbfC family nucleoid-associated protein [Parachlamydiaceae bacterium]|nr:YbaB/EbfC family nucleoid-associated protein [Parachlamydiaceae bacterium]